MYFTGTTDVGSSTENEDWSATTPDLVVVLDGATVRTETGCRHGAAWFARKLGAAILSGAAVRSTPLRDVLADAIGEVAQRHPECDLTHPGTPSAGVAIVRLDDGVLRWLVLGDVTVVLDTTTDGIVTVSDQRISASATRQRAEADRYLIGTAEKAAALVAMKHVELAARNTPDGYWIAAADPAAVEHAITGEASIDTVPRFAVLTDGAARFVDMFSLGEWDAVLDTIGKHGPRAFTQRVRRAEESDPLGAVYPRNKTSDDATVVLVELAAAEPKQTQPADKHRPEVTDEQRVALARDLLARINAPQVYGDGNLHPSDLYTVTECRRCSAAGGSPPAAFYRCALRSRSLHPNGSSGSSASSSSQTRST